MSKNDVQVCFQSFLMLFLRPVMENRFLQHFIIPCYGVDASMFMKPASFMDFAQEAANRHADIMGFGYDNLQETGIAWVLSRIHIRFVKHPVWRDEVDFVTWHKGLRGFSI